MVRLYPQRRAEGPNSDVKPALLTCPGHQRLGPFSISWQRRTNVWRKIPGWGQSDRTNVRPYGVEERRTTPKSLERPVFFRLLSRELFVIFPACIVPPP